MVTLVLGILLFSISHLQKRVLNKFRNRFKSIIGEKSYKGLITLLILFSLLLIIIGYRKTESIILYDLGYFGLFLNNILMLIAVALFGLGHSRSRIKNYIKNPMLLGIIFWSLSHLIANGSLKSFILFFSFGLWASIQIYLLRSLSEKNIKNNNNKTLSIFGDIILFFTTLTIYLVISVIHIYFGVNPLV